ncbi:MAG: lysophospholipid acyltransferase family protein [Verrucomicrobia bacterium]|nr:lysophospholipid acyltransferase family protein [Verrucomicrobiota bacterium]
MKRRFAYWLIYAIVRTLGATLRFRVVDDSGLVAGGFPGNYIFAFWHNRMAMMPMLFRSYVGRRKIAVLASASRDGDYSAGVQRWFGFTPVRGSTSRRAHQGFLELTRLVMEGYSASITPDGPRGPRYVAQLGVVKLAAMTGVPIMPVSATAEPCKRLKSWDRTIIPLPFSRCVARAGKPISVPRDADDATLEEYRLKVERALMELAGEEKNA